MARFGLGRCFRWAGSAVACLGTAYALLIASGLWLHPARTALTDSSVGEAVAELTTSFAGGAATPSASRLLAVPPDAILAERRVINGYEVTLWEPAAGQWWVHGHCHRSDHSARRRDAELHRLRQPDRPRVGQRTSPGDGIPELVLELYSGGASCCVSYVVAESGRRSSRTSHFLSALRRGRRSVDLDADGDARDRRSRRLFPLRALLLRELARAHRRAEVRPRAGIRPRELQTFRRSTTP